MLFFTNFHSGLNSKLIVFNLHFWHSSTNNQGATLKGQVKPKADWRAVDSHKKQTNLFCLLFCFSQKTKQIHSFIFWGDSVARQSCFRFYLTFNQNCFHRLQYGFELWCCRNSLFIIIERIRKKISLIILIFNAKMLD